MKYVLLAYFVGTISGLLAQNNFGSLHSNYTPTNSVFVNPSSILDSKVWLDINIAGAGSYINNDLVYLHDQNWIPIARDAANNELRLTEDDVQYNHGKNRYHAYNRNFVNALGAVWNQGDHAAQLSINARSYTAVRKIPDYVAFFIDNGVPPYTIQHDIDYSLKNVRAASLQFAEIKGSYAYTFLKRRSDLYMGGISFTKIFSIMGGGANLYNFDFLVDNDSLAVLYHLKSDLMYTPEAQFNVNGGFGIDLGFTYERLMGEAASYFPNSPKLGCRTVPYKYKIGVSIIDIGSMKLAEEDYHFAGYDFSDYYWLQYDEEEIDEANVTNVFEEVEQTITEGEVKDPGKIRLPTYFSVQYDRNLWRSRIYLNATLIQGIPPGKRKFGIRHANSFSITPRYESYFFDLAIPISLYEYQYPQLGISLRIGPITIGTDKLISWIAKSDLYGADIYAHLKVPIRYHPKCKGKFSPAKFENGQKYKKYHPCDAYN